jgi:hypothetical protein
VEKELLYVIKYSTTVTKPVVTKMTFVTKIFDKNSSAKFHVKPQTWVAADTRSQSDGSTDLQTDRRGLNVRHACKNSDPILQYAYF